MRNLSIRSRLLIIFASFLIPFIALGYNLVSKINAEIKFSEKQNEGVIYIKPLLGLLNEIADYQIAVLRKQDGDTEAEKDIKAGIEAVDSLFVELADNEKIYAKALEISSDNENSVDFTTSSLKKSWDNIRASSDYSDSSYTDLLEKLTKAVKYVGNSSGMILDPELDSYYLVDVSLSLPQMLETLAAIKSETYKTLSKNGGRLDDSGRSLVTVKSTLIHKVLFPRSVEGIDTSISEDKNFNGVSKTLEPNLEKAMSQFYDGSTQLEETLDKLLKGEQLDAGKFIEIADIMHDGTADFGWTVLGELKALIDIRLTNLYDNRLTSLTGYSLPVIFSFIMFFIISNGISKPIIKLTNVMQKLADGDTSVEVPSTTNKDEIGSMAKAVLVFKNNMEDNNRLKEEQEKNKELLDVEKREVMHKMATEFERDVKGIVSTVASAATELSQTARGMSSSVSHSVNLASDATKAANTTNSNIQSVAAATEELSASVREISGQIQKTNLLVQQSTEKTEQADKLAIAFNNASNRVEEVMGMISNIAGQINLLALNATIESARAGEAGKGFAVVASEVKNLADQTGKSIGESQAVIDEMRSASVAITQALEDIKKSVNNISGATTTVASAVEEQSATTNEISSNMQTAAQGAQIVNNSLREVTNSSTQAGAASQQMLAASLELSQQAEKLNLQVDTFISKIRAA